MGTKINPNLLAVTNPVNLLDNGGFEVWQRGAGPFTTSGGTQIYGADRWKILANIGSACQVDRESTELVSGNYALKYNRTTGGSAWSGIYQLVENYKELRGKTLTFSVKVKTTMASTVQARMYGVNSSFHTGSGNWETLTVTATIPSNATELLIAIWIPDGNTNTGIFYVDEAILVVGDKATPFTPEAPAIDLARCQRYYWKVTNSFYWAAYTASGQPVCYFIPFPQTMAGTPTISISGGLYTGTFNQIPSSAYATKDGFSFAISAASGTGFGSYRQEPSNTGYFSAEIT